MQGAGRVARLGRTGAFCTPIRFPLGCALCDQTVMLHTALAVSSVSGPRELPTGRRGIGSPESAVMTAGQNYEQPVDLGLVPGISNGDSLMRLSS